MNSRSLLVVRLLGLVFLLHSVSADNMSIRMMEETPVNTEIGSILLQLDSLSSSTSDSLSFVSQSSFFAVSQAAGRAKIVVKRRIDLETLCISNKMCCGVLNCVLSFNVLVSGLKRGEIFQSIDVKVHVLDKNDHEPKFPGDSSQILTLSEFSQIGTSVSLSPAMDEDMSSANRIQTYQLLESTTTFKLDRSRLPSLSLTIAKKLDYETTNTYTAELKACDQETCTSQNLTINIKDENDNSPVFERNQYNFSVREDMEIGTVIGKVRAVDRDSGKFGELSYSISADADADLQATFAVRLLINDRYSDTRTYSNSAPLSREKGGGGGQLVLRQKLATSTRSDYSFRVVACDLDPTNAKQTHTQVLVTVLDVNNHRPVIKVIMVPAGVQHSQLTVRENAGPRYIATLKVSDDDKGHNAVVQCRLANESLRNFQLIQKGSDIYSLKSLTSFDHELVQKLDVRVVCHDNGEPSLESVEVLTVHISDENEFHPRFQTPENPSGSGGSSSSGVYNGQVRENSPRGTRVLQVKAIDEDFSAALRYELDNYGSEYFVIDKTSGLITCGQKSLDRERTPTLTFTVHVTDSLQEPKSASAQVKVSVLDANDNAPIFSTAELPQFSVIENTQPTRLVGRLSAHDADADENGRVVFSLRNTWNGHSLQKQEGLFNVVKTGHLETLSSLDRETCDLFILEVVASDNPSGLGHPTSSSSGGSGQHRSLTTRLNVTLRVLDENDNAPQWTYPDLDEYNISDAMRPGDHLIQVNAIDRDTGHNGQVRYQIKQQQQLTGGLGVIDRAPFEANSTTGQLWVADRLWSGSIRLLLEASDLGQPVMSSQRELTVHISAVSAATSDSSFLGGGGRLNSTIIAVMISITVLVSLFLLIAIFCVRRRPPPSPPLTGTGATNTPPPVPSAAGGHGSMVMVVAAKDNGVAYPPTVTGMWPGDPALGYQHHHGSGSGSIGYKAAEFCAPESPQISVAGSRQMMHYPLHQHQQQQQQQYYYGNSGNQDIMPVQLHSFATPNCVTYEHVDGDSGDSGRGPSEEGSNPHHISQDGNGYYFSLRGPLRNGSGAGGSSTFRPSAAAISSQTPNSVAATAASSPFYPLPEDPSVPLISPLTPRHNLLQCPPAPVTPSPLLYCPTNYSSLTLPQLHRTPQQQSSVQFTPTHSRRDHNNSIATATTSSASSSNKTVVFNNPSSTNSSGQMMTDTISSSDNAHIS